MQSSVYRKVEGDFSIKRQHAQSDARHFKKNVYDENPKLAEIEDKINKLSLKSIKSRIFSDDLSRQIEQDKLTLQLDRLDREYIEQLTRIGLTKKDFEPKYECTKCNDTGYVGNKMCSCFNQALINESFKQSNICKLKDENFETFDFGYYSSNNDKEKYGIEKSPLENIDAIRKLAYNFSHNLDEPSQKNLLFTGSTGLGKTFLANCVAAETIKQGKSVIYQTAPILLDKMVDFKFKLNKTEAEREEYDKIFTVDLLILDDLGTEAMNNAKFSELFNILNTRLLKDKKILISTNLTPQDIKREYEERIFSRFVGDFIICRFVGEDIRLLKKKLAK
ncbi:MAG: ATP-binding protein [Clostridia bacterium]